MSLITRNAKEYRVLSLRHPNHLVLAGSNNRNVIITYRFLADFADSVQLTVYFNCQYIQCMSSIK